MQLLRDRRAARAELHDLHATTTGSPRACDRIVATPALRGRARLQGPSRDGDSGPEKYRRQPMRRGGTNATHRYRTAHAQDRDAASRHHSGVPTTTTTGTATAYRPPRGGDAGNVGATRPSP
eukprot:3472333-Pyramimonas_sp.AAC.1